MTGVREAGEERFLPRALFGVFVVALLFRFLHLLQASAAPEFAIPWLDQRFYHEQAQALAAGQPIAFTGFRSILYPWMVSLVYRVAGPDPAVVIWLQSMLGCVTAVLCAFAAWELTRRISAALCAGGWMAMYPTAMVYEAALLTATLSLLLLSTFSLAMIRGLQETPSKKAFVALGFLPGILLHLTPQLALILLAPLFCLRGVFKPRLWVLGGLGLAMVCMALVHGIVAGRVLVAGGAGGINAWLGNRPGADGIYPKQSRAVAYQGGYQDPIELLALEEAQERLGHKAEMSVGEVSSYWWGETIRSVAAAPLRWAKLMMRKAWVCIWNAEPPNVMNPEFWERQVAPFLRWIPAGWGLLLPFAVAGLWRGDRRIWGLAATWSLGCLGLCLFFVNSRYRLPLAAPLSLLAGAGWVALPDVFRKRRGYAFLWMVVVAMFSFGNWGKVEAFPQYPEWMSRGEAYLLRNQPEKAMESYKHALKLNPDDVGLLFGLGNSYFAAKQLQEAEDIYARALEKMPNHPLLQHNRARALDMLGRMQEARTAYQKALELKPDNRLAAGQLAMLYIRMGEIGEAESWLRRPRPPGLGMAPQEEVAMVWLLEMAGQTAPAEEIRKRLYQHWGEAVSELFEELPPTIK